MPSGNRLTIKQLRELSKTPLLRTWIEWAKVEIQRANPSIGNYVTLPSQLLEDMLVLDAASLYQDEISKIWHPLDGALIRPLVDSDGVIEGYGFFENNSLEMDFRSDKRFLYLPRNRQPNSFWGISPLEEVAIAANQSNAIAVKRAFGFESPERMKSFHDWYNDLGRYAQP